MVLQNQAQDNKVYRQLPLIKYIKIYTERWWDNREIL